MNDNDEKDNAENIVRGLAAKGPIQNEYDFCSFCHWQVNAEGHHESCLYLRAVKWCEENPK